MRIAFAGTPVFAQTALAHLHSAGFDIALVLTQPDRPSGRGMKLQASAVKEYALAHGLDVIQPRSLRAQGPHADEATRAVQALTQACVQVLVVAAYGLILPPSVLAVPARGCINIHASVLPRWRGAAPIHRAIEAGDAVSGVTIMQMDAGLDTGDMLLVQSMPVRDDDTTATLQDRLAPLGGRLIVQALRSLEQGVLEASPQPADGATYAKKVDKAQARIDWGQDAAVLERRLRAFDPQPGASTVLAGQVVKCWRGAVVPGRGRPGQVLQADAAGIVVACGHEALSLTQLQRAGGKRQSAAQFLQSHPLAPGAVFESEPAAA